MSFMKTRYVRMPPITQSSAHTSIFGNLWIVAQLGAVLGMTGCGSPSPIKPSYDLVEAPSVSLYAIPIRDRDREIALALRILNQPWSRHSIWLDSSEVRTVSTLYWDFQADVFDEQVNRVDRWCVDDSSPITHSKYVVLKPGEHLSVVLKPWCPGWLRSERTLFFQVKWFDSNRTPPPAPAGAMIFRGPLVAPIAKYDPTTVSADPDWSRFVD
jgi:hypothetical protein